MQESDLLQQKSEKLFPDNYAMQVKWVDAINFLRGGRGWILDTFVPKNGG